jgi:hypothetical protein
MPMSLESLPDGWRRFGGGRRWRCAAPRYLCEVDDDGNTPNYLSAAATVRGIRRIRAFYLGRLEFGVMDERGTALDALVANSLAESGGTVPSPLDTRELRDVYARQIGTDAGAKLDHVVRYVADRARMLERREPGYVDPVRTPSRVSLGAHQVLVSTALGLSSQPAREGPIADLVCRVPAESLFAATLAIRYFNRSYARHSNEPPLMAATYNAGSPVLDTRNAWHLRQYGNHVDRWVAYYNTSRLITAA